MAHAEGDGLTPSGPLAEQVRQLFRVFARRHGLDGGLPPLDPSRFRPPPDPRGQGWLF